MERTVWVQDWQMQCCGHPFTIGQRVSWSTSKEVDREYLGAVLGAQAPVQIMDYEDHHNMGATTLIEGTVGSIEAVWCRFAPQGRDFLSFYPVPGTTKIESRNSADGWEEDVGNLFFVGYVVKLSDVEVMEPRGWT